MTASHSSRPKNRVLHGSCIIPELLFTPAAVPPLVFELAIPVLLSSERNEFLGCKISNIKFGDKQSKAKMLALNNRVSTSLLQIHLQIAPISQIQTIAIDDKWNDAWESALL
ncbi:hypothetical protein NC652_028841 [Populus alba x Populus x berolinensis]|nr:hypothetical protein NC652_028841 [Populus alba x Populus x berolinensis]